MKTGLLVIVAILVSLAVPGCTASESRQPTKTIQVPIDDVMNQQVVTRESTLAVGDTLKVTLGSNHTTPYRWMAETQIGDPTIVQQTSHEFVEPSSVGGNTTGAPGTEVWTFKALKAGTTTIATDYTMGSSTRSACTFTAKVTVR
jgi:inhibitor of cysteine peptidase